MRSGFFLIPLTMALALVTGQSLRPSTSPPLLHNQLEYSALDCKQPLEYSVGYKREDNGVSPRGRGFRFDGIAWISTDICSPGDLIIQASGEVAGGDAPKLTVSLNSSTITDFHVLPEEKTYNVHIPHAGRLTLGYFNDYYLADVRVATLDKFQFLAPTCRTFQVSVPETTGGTWRPDDDSASLVSDVPMSVTPCAAGELEVQVAGRKGNGTFPILNFRQQGKILRIIPTKLEGQTIKLTLSATPLSINMTNPYGLKLADRNLNITTLEFTPSTLNLP